MILLLTSVLFIWNIQAQTFFEKYYKQIYGTTVVVSLFCIGYLLRTGKNLKDENFDLKRENWKRVNAGVDVLTQTETIKLEL